MLLPAQPLLEHIAVLDAAVVAQTADSQPHVKTPKLQFAAVRHPSIEHSLGEISNGQVQQQLTYNGADHQQEVVKVPLDDRAANQQQLRPSLVQATSADNGLSSGNDVSGVSKCQM